MNIVPANSLSPATVLFTEPGNSLPSWPRLGSNDQGTYVEAPLAKPPPFVVRKLEP
jgi:hypothetical protein